MADAQRRLSCATKKLGQELSAIHEALVIYRIIAPNHQHIPPVYRRFFSAVRAQSVWIVALGFSKVFEREGDYPLCSVSGIYRLAKQVAIHDKDAADTFVHTYGVRPSADWRHDVDQVRSRQRPLVTRHMPTMKALRNTRLAHLQQDAPDGMLPSLDAFETLLAYAVDFHAFIVRAFCRAVPPLILEDQGVEQSLVSLLRSIGVPGPLRQFSE